MMKNQQGFMLLLSAVIVTSAVIILGIALSSSKLSFKREILNTEFGSKNFVTAHACLEEAVYRLKEYGDAIGYAVDMNGQLCTVYIQNNKNPYKITVTATNNERTRRLEAQVQLIGDNWYPLYWREVKEITAND